MQGNQPHTALSAGQKPPVTAAKTVPLNQGELKVLTLNYCGIMNNPFEFYSQSFWSELDAISNIFKQLVQQYFKLQDDKGFKWNMGKVEQKVRMGRYSPSFDL